MTPFIFTIVALFFSIVEGGPVKEWPWPYTPTQPGLTSKCRDFHRVSYGEDCHSISHRYGVSTDDFLNWNPSIGPSCDNLSLGYYVCVGISKPSTVAPAAPTFTIDPKPPTPTQAGIISNCNKYYKAQRGDNCHSIANKKENKFTMEKFIKWNPAVGVGCTNLLVGYYYCVGIPSPGTSDPTPNPDEDVPEPLQPGVTPSCRKYHLVERGDNCFSLEQKYGISDADFRKWNPNVGEDCSNLWMGYYVCIKV